MIFDAKMILLKKKKFHNTSYEFENLHFRWLYLRQKNGRYTTRHKDYWRALFYDRHFWKQFRHRRTGRKIIFIVIWKRSCALWNVAKSIKLRRCTSLQLAPLDKHAVRASGKPEITDIFSRKLAPHFTTGITLEYWNCILHLFANYSFKVLPFIRAVKFTSGHIK